MPFLVHSVPLLAGAVLPDGAPQSAAAFFAQEVVNGLMLGSIYALIALGYTMVYGVLRLINFAHGDVFMVGSYITYLFVSRIFTSHPYAALDTPGHYWQLWGLAGLAMLLAMVGCGLLGVIIERFAYRPVRRAPRLTPLITAIGVSLLLENLAVQPFVFGASPDYCPAVLPNDLQVYHIGSVSVGRDGLILVAATLILLVALWYVVSRTRLGKAMRAVSYDRDAASLMGINIDNLISFTFFLGSALAGAGAFLFAAMTHDQIIPTMGIMPGVKAFVAAVLGGIGNIPGAALGGFIMGLAETLVRGYAPAAHIPSSYSDAVAFLILIVILLVKPSGLLGKGIVEKV